MTSFGQVLAIAMSQRGVTEWPPDSNRQKYGAWYGWNGVYWCDQFISWCFNQAGGLDLIGGKSASVYLTASRMQAIGRYGATPQPGALAIFNNFSHIELVVSVNRDGTLSTIGGNTSDHISGSISNGGGVFANVRPRSLIRGYCYPNYVTATPGPTPAQPGNQLVVDGALGPNTYRALQRWVGVAQDGVFGLATKEALQRKVGTTQDGAIGPITIEHLQAIIGATQDGAWGPGTTKALQIYLNRMF